MTVVTRRPAREAVLGVFYEVEVGDADIREVAPRVFDEADLDADRRAYAERLIEAFREHRTEIDQRLSAAVRDYEYERLAAIDRNILRFAATELLYIPEMPPAVTINEAIEISKVFSSAESGRFINGVLGRLLAESDKVVWDPKRAPVEAIVRAEPIIAEEEEVDVDSEEGKKAKQFGWVVRSDAEQAP